MFLDLLKEVYYLMKFKSAIRSTNLGDASRFLDSHRKASDAVELQLNNIMDSAKEEMNMQKSLIDNLINKL